MSAFSPKLIAATVLIAGGLGTVLFPIAQAQIPGGPPGSGGGAPPARGSGFGPGAPGTGAPPPGTGFGITGVAPGMPAGFGTGVVRQQWHYAFAIGMADFAHTLVELGREGWEYCGTVEPTKEQLAGWMKAHAENFVRRGEGTTVLVFKRPHVPPSPQGAGGPVGPSTAPRGGGFPGGAENPFTNRPAPAGAPPIGGGAPGAAGDPVLIRLKNAKAAELAAVLEKLFGKSLTISADERTNSIVIVGDSKLLDDVKSLVEELDTPIVGRP